MIAFKGFTKDLRSVYGNGEKETCNFLPGETKTVSGAKTGRGGFHCTENPFDCLQWYRLGNSRIWKVEAAGNIDEGEDCRIACTRITLLEELDMLHLAYEGMKYMIAHPRRPYWQQDRGLLKVEKDTATAVAGGIAIARGRQPQASGPKGSILGILVEDEHGEIVEARMRRVEKDMEMLV